MEIAQQVIGIIQKPEHRVVNRWNNSQVQNAMRNEIDDYFFEVVRDEMNIDFPIEALDDLELKLMALARARFA